MEMSIFLRFMMILLLKTHSPHTHKYSLALDASCVLLLSCPCDAIVAARDAYAFVC